MAGSACSGRQRNDSQDDEATQATESKIPKALVQRHKSVS
jgi:hypothetical protein